MFNVTVSLGVLLRGTPFCGLAGGSSQESADVSIVCGEPELLDGHDNTPVKPTLVVEVLSPATELFDRGGKWLRYRRIESLTGYLLVVQDEARVEHFARQNDGRWVTAVAEGPDASLEIASLGVRLLLSDIYDTVTFPAEPASDLPPSETPSARAGGIIEEQEGPRMTITLTPQTEARLREKAEQEGQGVDDVAEAMIAFALEWQARDREEAIEGIRRGLEDSAAGRVTPLEQVIAEARQKHGFPASWPRDVDAGEK